MIQLIAFLYPVITGILSGIVPLRDKKNHRLVCGLIMILTDLLGILAMIRAERVEILHFSEKAVLSFALDDLGRFALAAVLILFTAVCFYSFTYMEHEKRTPMFFTFFFIALGAMMAVCMSADMVTLYFAFELATLSTVPMVMHEMSKESVTAGFLLHCRRSDGSSGCLLCLYLCRGNGFFPLRGLSGQRKDSRT